MEISTDTKKKHLRKSTRYYDRNSGQTGLERGPFTLVTIIHGKPQLTVYLMAND